MEIGTIEIMLLLMVIHALMITLSAYITSLMYQSRGQQTNQATRLHKIIGWLLTVLIAIFGYYSLAVFLEFINFTIDVGGHNAVGTVFIVFFVILLFGKWLMNMSVRIVEKKLACK